ncbi:MAG: AAA family ATPase [Gemmobacter sp.]
MITGVAIKGLKRFKDQRFELAPLSVLTGLNGSGKTSMIQAILLAAEASTTKSSSLSLNGPFGLELGTAEDVLNWESTSPISVSFEGQGGEIGRWQFAVPAEDALYLEIVDVPDNPPKAFSGDPRMFTYLSAERLGPRGYTAASPLPESELEVGVHGEYCAHVLSVLGDQVIKAKERAHPLYRASAPRLLKYEVEQWLSEITRPIEVTGERAQNSIVAELKFRSSGATWVRSTNMGFGISYALPIVLAGLIAESGGLFLIENPEAHLHPAGQSRMGVFLAWLAGKGVEMIIETHSDHIINGIRRAVAEHHYLDPSSVVIHWLGDADDDRKPISASLSIGETGGVSDWPKGFFDQYQIDVSSLGRIRRGRREP